MKHLRLYVLTSFVALVPIVVRADNHNDPDVSLTGVTRLFSIVRSIINMIVPLLFALAVMFFLYGIFKYFFFHAEEPEKREEGKKFILWGIIALFVMVSFWGLVNILSNTFFGVRVPDPGDTSWHQDSEEMTLLASAREGRSVVRVWRS